MSSCNATNEKELAERTAQRDEARSLVLLILRCRPDDYALELAMREANEISSAWSGNVDDYENKKVAKLRSATAKRDEPSIRDDEWKSVLDAFMQAERTYLEMRGWVQNYGGNWSHGKLNRFDLTQGYAVNVQKQLDHRPEFP